MEEVDDRVTYEDCSWKRRRKKDSYSGPIDLRCRHHHLCTDCTESALFWTIKNLSHVRREKEGIGNKPPHCAAAPESRTLNSNTTYISGLLLFFSPSCATHLWDSAWETRLLFETNTEMHWIQNDSSADTTRIRANKAEGKLASDVADSVVESVAVVDCAAPVVVPWTPVVSTDVVPTATVVTSNGTPVVPELEAE